MKFRIVRPLLDFLGFVSIFFRTYSWFRQYCVGSVLGFFDHTIWKKRVSRENHHLRSIGRLIKTVDRSIEEEEESEERSNGSRYYDRRHRRTYIPPCSVCRSYPTEKASAGCRLYAALVACRASWECGIKGLQVGDSVLLYRGCTVDTQTDGMIMSTYVGRTGRDDSRSRNRDKSLSDEER